MVLAVGASIYGEEVALEIDDFDISKALVVGEDETREVSTPGSNNPRPSRSGAASALRRGGRLLLHARGRVTKTRRSRSLPLARLLPPTKFGTPPRMSTRRRCAPASITAAVPPSSRTSSEITSPRTPIWRGRKPAWVARSDSCCTPPRSMLRLHGLFISRRRRTVRPRRTCRCGSASCASGAVAPRSPIDLAAHAGIRSLQDRAITLMTEAGVVVASVEAVGSAQRLSVEGDNSGSDLSPRFCRSFGLICGRRSRTSERACEWRGMLPCRRNGCCESVLRFAGPSGLHEADGRRCRPFAPSARRLGRVSAKARAYVESCTT